MEALVYLLLTVVVPASFNSLFLVLQYPALLWFIFSVLTNHNKSIILRISSLTDGVQSAHRIGRIND